MKRYRLFPLLFAAAACVTSQPLPTQTNHSLDKQGHRGCRGLMPENTVAAMYKAIDLGVTTLEMDAVITKDGEVVLSHEPFFNHEISTKPNGQAVTEAEEKSLNIYRMSYAQTKAFDVGLKPHPRFPQQQKLAAAKPRLSEVIDSVKLYCQQKGVAFPQWNIETKSQPATDNLFHPAPAPFVEALMNVIREKDVEKHVIIQSFDFRTLQYLHQKHPAVKTAVLVEDYDKRPLNELLTALGFTPTIYSPHYSLVTAEAVNECRQKGIKIIPWTVNELAEMKRLTAMGVNGIITDYPNLFAELLTE